MKLVDGNFSFSAELLKKLLDFRIEFELTATSYDSYEALRSKYPEIQGIINHLKRDHRVTIFHGVDATKYLPLQLLRHNIDGDTSLFRHYHHVVFNFPHLGIEDASAHSSMIAHTMHRAKDVLDTNESSLYITLAHRQAERWSLAAQAERNGFVKSAVIPFRRENWLQYTQKRHHCGKSFHSRIDGASHFCFNIVKVRYFNFIIFREIKFF